MMAYTASWAQRTVTGSVTGEEDGTPIPGVNVILKGTTTGTVTDVDGKYQINVPEEGGTLVFSFIGLATEEVEIGSQSVIDMVMTADIKQLTEIVVTALGIEREAVTLPYASQEVQAEQLNITQNNDIKGALAGKVAGVQIVGQAGSKLGQAGKIRIRGAIAITSDRDPLYVVDGVPVPDPNDVDVENIESINVLKGPNATALWGQRADAGVVLITTKKGSGNLSVQLINSTTFDKVAYLPKFQNLYGQGYEGDDSFSTFDYNAGAIGPYPEEWQIFDGKRYIQWDNNYADESWGPKFDGQEYVPWYAWWPESPYYGQTAKWEAQPDNVKNFYETGVTLKNGIVLSGGNDSYKGMLSYTNLSQSGVTHYTSLVKNYIVGNFEFKPVKKLTIVTNMRYAISDIRGDFDDGYGNQTTGSFNSWFNRQLEMDKMKEMKDLTTLDGYSASWNWWGPDYYTIGGSFKKPAFWFNPYTFQERYEKKRRRENYSLQLKGIYEFSDKFELEIAAQRNSTQYRYEYFFPFFLANTAAPDLYNSWSNSFGKYDSNTAENNYYGMLKYKDKFGDFDLSAFVGGWIRQNTYRRISTQMPVGAKTGGLIIPDVYTFSNAGIIPTTQTYEWEKQVNSLYGNASLGYKDLAYLDISMRRDWSSALPASNNGYFYPSIGATFILSELMNDSKVLSFAKIRGGWAQVGNDVGALRINPTFNTAGKPFMGDKVIMYTPSEAVDPAIKPALNSSFEVGFDTRWANNRVGLSLTYYNEKREDEIIPISISLATGYNTYLTNAGRSSRRGFEVTFDADIFKSSKGFNWNLLVNWATNTTTIDELPGGLEAISAPGGRGAFGFVTMYHELGKEWGQLRGTSFKLDDNGNRIIQANGKYATVQNQFLGSVLPDFTGGIINTFSFRGISLIATMDYQKGGKFFSLTEQWGQYSGLLEETAALNDKGNNVRDAVADGGGVHVTGVTENGDPYDDYVEATSYFTQWYGNRLAEPFIHDASYIKLREMSLSYDFARLFESNFIKGLQVGFVARNIWRMAVAKDNVHRWDPSELSQTYGENGQLPGIRSYGFNLRLTF